MRVVMQGTSCVWRSVGAWGQAVVRAAVLGRGRSHRRPSEQFLATEGKGLLALGRTGRKARLVMRGASHVRRSVGAWGQTVKRATVLARSLVAD